VCRPQSNFFYTGGSWKCLFSCCTPCTQDHLEDHLEDHLRRAARGHRGRPDLSGMSVFRIPGVGVIPGIPGVQARSEISSHSLVVLPGFQGRSGPEYPSGDRGRQSSAQGRSGRSRVRDRNVRFLAPAGARTLAALVLGLGCHLLAGSLAGLADGLGVAGGTGCCVGHVISKRARVKQ
jgi:hypothetical protein